MALFSFADAARKLGCRPRDISDLFYARILDETQLVQIGNRRAIPEAYLPTVRDVLASRGKLKAELAAR
jgi:hypothetical protein